MRARTISIAIIAAAGLSLALFVALRAPRADRNDQGKAAAVNQTQTGLPASVVLSINPRRPSDPWKLSASARTSALSQEFERTRSLKALYERLSSPGGIATPEAKYVFFQILSSCASRSDNPRKVSRQKTNEARRKSLADSIPDSSAEKQQRLSLFDELALARCEGLESLTTTEGQLDRLLEDAAREGDPKARAHMAAKEINASATPTAANPTPQATLSDAQLATLREAVMSRDPNAMVIAGTALSNTFGDLVIEVGDSHDTLDGRAAREAWQLLACEYGLECGPANRQVRGSCVYGGQCGASSLADLIFYYGVSPYQSQLVDQYRQIFRGAVENNDWSQLQFVRRPNDSSNRYLFGPPGPR